ncbi:MAG: hypothetical protein K1X81_04890 [Bacteroidia bacterium]|nr:hypothetical protein [Bacteroidia bacterium]
MKLIIRIFFYIVAMVLVACEKKTQQAQQVGNHNILILSSKHAVSIITDSIVYVDSIVCNKVFPVNESVKILSAFVDCDHPYEIQFNDTSRLQIICKKELEIENDTVKIWVGYDKAGLHKFHKITLFLKDQDNNISYIDTSFTLSVIDR